MDEQILKRFLNQDMQVTQWPAKHSNKRIVLEYLATKFESDRVYQEPEVNEILKAWHTFSDWPLLRRALVDTNLMTRTPSGTDYRVTAGKQD